jgi:CRP-like cAMP-binding protein
MSLHSGSRFLFGAYGNTAPLTRTQPSPSGVTSKIRPGSGGAGDQKTKESLGPSSCAEPQGDLRSIPVFADLPREAVAELASLGTVRREATGAVICAQGALSARLEIVLRGAFKLVRTTQHALGRATLVIDVGRGPALLPTLSLFDGQPEAASIVTLRSANILSVDRRVVFRMAAQHPSFGRALLRFVSQAARRHVRRIDEVASGPVDDRVRHLLEDLAAQHGTAFGHGRFIAIPLRRKDIGCMVSATMETVSRVLARFEREGLTRSTRDGIWLRVAASPMRTSEPPASGSDFVSGDALASSSRGAR